MSNSKLYVGNLSFRTTESELENAFSEFGNVTSVTLVVDRETGRPRGFGFVEMSTPEEAQAAIEGMDNQDLGGRNLKVNLAKPREDRPRGGGGGGRGGFGGGGGGGYGGGGGGGYGGGRGGSGGGRDRW